MLEFFFCSKGWLLTGCLTVHVQAVLTGDPLKLKTFEMLLLGRVKAREGTRMKVEGGGGGMRWSFILRTPQKYMGLAFYTQVNA